MRLETLNVQSVCDRSCGLLPDHPFNRGLSNKRIVSMALFLSPVQLRSELSTVLGPALPNEAVASTTTSLLLALLPSELLNAVYDLLVPNTFLQQSRQLERLNRRFYNYLQRCLSITAVSRQRHEEFRSMFVDRTTMYIPKEHMSTSFWALFHVDAATKLRMVVFIVWIALQLP